MFNILKKILPGHRSDAELDVLANAVIEEGQIFTAKVVGNLPKDYTQRELAMCLASHVAYADSDEFLHKEYITRSKISFEGICFLLEYVSRHFNALPKKVGDDAYQELTSRILEHQAKTFQPIWEGTPREIYNHLVVLLNERGQQYARLKRVPSLNPGDSEFFNEAVGDVAASKVCELNDRTGNFGNEERWRVRWHLYSSGFPKKFETVFQIIKAKQ